MEPIYTLKKGDRFRVYGIEGVGYDDFTVIDVIDMLVVGRNASGNTLIFPMDRPLPFAVYMLNGDRQAEEVKTVATAPDAVQTEEDVTGVQPQVDEAEVAEPEKPADENIENTGADETGAVIPAAETESEKEPEPQKEPERIEGTVQYYDVIGHWGKLSHHTYKSGIFFHVSNVEDDKLRECLSRLRPGQEWPHMKVTYLECRSERRPNNYVAGYIRPAEEIPDIPDKTEPVEGFLIYNKANQSGTIADVNGSRYYYNEYDIADPYLKQYLKDYLPLGEIDSRNIKIRFKPFNRKAVALVWINHEDCSDIMEELTEKITPEEKSNYEQFGDLRGEGPKPEQELSTTPFHALPLK